jgi:hypothetical protein
MALDSMDPYRPIRELLDGVRARWRLLRLFRAVARGAAWASAVLAAGLVVARFSGSAPLALIAVVAVSAVAATGVIAFALMPAREVPSDRRVARFIEECTPALDDRLVTAVDFLESGSLRISTPARRMLADAATWAQAVDLDAVFPRARVRTAGWHAAGAAIVLLLVLFLCAGPAKRSADAASLLLFPAHARLSVRPGDARVKAGSAVTIDARIADSRATVPARLEIEGRAGKRVVDMADTGTGEFSAVLEAVTAPFRYRVLAGSLVSASYAIAVAAPPRVTRVDLEYTYPASLGLKARTERDSGDIYAPPGTDVRVSVHADHAIATGKLAVSNGRDVPLVAGDPLVMSATLKVLEDATYRILLADAEGFSSEGDTEYFIRTVDDRPPEVHVTRPGGDRGVTRLEEVDIEVEADDDHGVDRLELVYAVRGGVEQTVKLRVPEHATSVAVEHTLFLEDLDIAPGDFVSYYARAWDRTGGTKPRTVQSDIFFLDVKPYEQEFALAQSQSMSGSGYAGALDGLVDRQRQVVVATWKLNRRAEAARGAQSARDIRAVAATEAELRSLVEQTASTFRESTMRDPRRREPDASTRQSRPEEDAMAAASGAMERAVTSLEGLDVGNALPPEMEALNHLLKAQAEVKRRELSSSQSAAAAAGNANRNYDLSTLFDRELQRQQQTTYETPKENERPRRDGSITLDQLKELARRQDELLGRQRELTQTPIPADEHKRALEQLTRDQSDLRQRAEDLGRRMSRDRRTATQPQGRRNGAQQEAQPNGLALNGDSQGDLQQVSEAMRQAAGDLRRGAADAAGASGSRALAGLRDLERRVQPSDPGAERRALGDWRLEKVPPGDAGRDAARRLAGDEARLAERMRRLQDAAANRVAAGPRPAMGADQDAVRGAARDSAALSSRIQRAADDLRGVGSPSRQRGVTEDIARQLDRFADRLGSAIGERNDDARILSEQLARAEELRDKLEQVGQAFENASRENGRAAGTSAQKTAGDSGRTGEGRRGAGGTDLSKIREESLRRLQEARALLDEVSRQDPGSSRNGAGFTLEGQGMVLSAPGTEAFKQDFARWDMLKRQAIAALEQAGSTLARRAHVAAAKDRLAAGVEDAVPPAYRQQVDDYFRSLAVERRP